MLGKGHSMSTPVSSDSEKAIGFTKRKRKAGRGVHVSLGGRPTPPLVIIGVFYCPLYVVRCVSSGARKKCPTQTLATNNAGLKVPQINRRELATAVAGRMRASHG